MKKFSGTGIAMVTPFNTKREVDLPALKKLTEHLIAGGVEYLVVLGTTGESATLTSKEKDTAIRTVMETNKGRLPIVLGCGGNDTYEVSQTIREYSHRYEPDAFLSVSPYYSKPTQKGIELHYKEVCSHTELPIILYNVPGRTSSNLLPDTVLRIAENCPNVIAIKEASGNVEQGMEIIKNKKPDFMVLSGDDVLGVAQIAVGYEGVISVAGNAIPRQFSEMVRLALAGRMQDACAIHYKIMELMQVHFAEGNPAGVKATLELLGICGAAVRLPLAEASEELKKKIDGLLHSVRKVKI